MLRIIRSHSYCKDNNTSLNWQWKVVRGLPVYAFSFLSPMFKANCDPHKKNKPIVIIRHAIDVMRRSMTWGNKHYIYKNAIKIRQ